MRKAFYFSSFLKAFSCQKFSQTWECTFKCHITLSYNKVVNSDDGSACTRI